MAPSSSISTEKQSSMDSSVTHVCPPSVLFSHKRPSAHSTHDDPEKLKPPAENTEEAGQDLWEFDPENARNWPSRKKWIMVGIVSLYTLIPPLGSSMVAPSLPEIAEDYQIKNPTTLALVLSIFLVSFALGPLVLAPLSEMYGRTWVLHIGNLFSIVFSIGCAFSPNTSSLIAFRFLTGFSGSAPIACGAGSIGDLFSERDRASAMSFYTLGPLLGPALGPIVGGFIAQSAGVKYVFILLAGISGLGALLGLPFLEETYAPVIQMRKAKHLERDPESSIRMATFRTPWEGMSKSQYIWVNLSRPVILLTRSFICFILSLYMAFMYGIYYLMFATFADFFHDAYGFGPGIGGLVYLGLGGGFMLATAFGAKWADKIYKYLADRNGGQGKPEMRIPALFVGSLIVPVGLFWYGWSAAVKLHWMMPIVGAGIYGFGMMTTYLPISLYLVDAFKYAASALAAASVFRSLFGFAFPLFAKSMFDVLGMGPGNSLLGGLTIVLGIPFPIWIYYKGEAIRQRSDLNR